MPDDIMELEMLSDKKRELFKLLINEKREKNRLQSIQDIQRRRDDAFPRLSFAQQRIWFLEQLEPGGLAYNIPSAVRLSGPLDAKILEKCINKVIDRHESLRTTFKEVSGQSVQVIGENQGFILKIVDSKGIPEDKKPDEIKRLALEDNMKVYDLGRGPLIRAALYNMGVNDNVLILNMHHSISDGWSIGILIKEISILYEAYALGKTVSLPELPIQYGDYAVWQNEWIQNGLIDKQLDYWTKALEGYSMILELPTDHARKQTQSFKGARHYLEIPAGLVDKLNKISLKKGATLFATLLTAFKILLYRYTGQEDIIVGTPVAGRNRIELEGLIGFFVNMLVLGSTFNGDNTFNMALVRERDMLTEAYENQELPFEYLVEKLQPERDWSRNPIFQVVFGYQNEIAQIASIPGIDISSIEINSNTARFDIELELWKTGDSITGYFEYSTDIFETGTISAMAVHYLTLLDSISTNSEQSISRLPIMPEHEFNKVLKEWNNTLAEFPYDSCISELFELQVDKSPENTAVIFENQKLSYRQLNEMSNKLACYLRKSGVGRETLVGVCMERSVEMVVGVYGIVKAGGAYVPIDPEYPANRQAYMLNDSKVGILLTQKKLLEFLPICDARIICLDSDWSMMEEENGDNPLKINLPSDPAYMIYTSGSTGNPKGVINVHRALVNRLNWMQKAFCLDEYDRVLQKTPFSFDVSVWEFFWPLLNGAALVIASPGGHKDRMYLIRTIREHNITTIHFVPSMLQIFIEEKDAEQCKSLKRVICSGEALPINLQNKFFQCLNAGLYNLYGPTEAAIDVTFWTCRKGCELNTIPIGRPIDNIKIYILSKDLQPVPVNVPGELCIGGVCLARGYYNRPELTKEKFVPDPFSDNAEDRLYRTGDLARFLPDGNIEYLGRIDFQVKIRGLRIELGEVEAILGSHPDVRECVAVVREDMPGNKQLAAYIAAHKAETLSSAMLREFMGRYLPDYMIPSIFIFLDKLPTTHNGKADRKALPIPDTKNNVRTFDYVAPRNRNEELMAGLWSEVLGIDKIGIYDSFFELGGHSLLATQIISRVRDVYKVDIPLRRFFVEHGQRDSSGPPTVARLAASVEEISRNKDDSTASVIDRIPRNRKMIPSFSQERLWFIDKLQPGNIAYIIPMALRFIGSLDTVLLERCINEIIRRHETLRTNFIDENGRPVLVIHDEKIVKLSIIDIQGLSEAESEKTAFELSKEQVVNPFDLSKDILIRAKLICFGKEDHVLLLAVHHIVFDLWSEGILIRELRSIYEAYMKKTGQSLPELSLQYADFAYWQRNWLKGDVLEKQLSYWKNKLKDIPASLELPTDRPRQPVQTYESGRQGIMLSKSLSKAVKEMSIREGVNLFILLLAAFKVLLSKYTGQEDIVIGSPIANRNRSEIEGMIGFFVNSLVMRTIFEGNSTFREVLYKVKDTALEAYDYQDMPFELLVDEIKPQRDLSRNPIFQVAFNFGNIPMPLSDIPGATISVMPAHSDVSQFDMTLLMWEENDILKSYFCYSTNLFDDITIERMAKHFAHILEQITRNININISDIDIMDMAERERVLSSFNGACVRIPNLTISKCFERQAGKTPDRIAVVDEYGKLTYDDLNRKADKLAKLIMMTGVKAGAVAGLMTDRSANTIVGILGILKAGCAYMPISSLYPSERIHYMLEDSGAELLIFPEKKDETGYFGKKIIYINDIETVESGDAVQADQIKPDTPAYVIYTSGSTGNPKGVMIENRSVINLVNGLEKAIYQQYEAPLNIALVSPFVFDASIKQIFPSLLGGNTLYIVPEEVRFDGARLINYYNKMAIDVSDGTPIHISIITNAMKNGSYPCVKHFVIGGEMLTVSLISRFMECFMDNKPHVTNVYGPTECCDISTAYTISDCNFGGLYSVPIGYPLDNIKIYILDRFLRPVPIGMKGDIYISGASVGRGYINNEKLTSERFVPCPFEKGSRMYRTGDIAKWHENGMIEYIERADEQVKIRGFRIEPGEIEAVICRYLDITNCTVIARDGRDGVKILCAYFESNGKVPVSALRLYLCKYLPDYMIPSYLIQLEEIPLSSNGKIDRKALPEPSNIIGLDQEYVLPTNETEEKLTDIWQKVIEVDKVGINDNFFSIGGNSLLLVQVHSMIEELFPGRVSLTDLFTFTTISKLAAHIIFDGAIKREGIILKGARLPEDYFVFDGNAHAASATNFSIQNELYAKIKEKADAVKIDLFDILVSAYAYTLAEIGGSESLTVHVLQEDGQGILPIDIDFSGLDNFLELMNAGLGQSGKNNAYKLEYLYGNAQKSDGPEAVALISRKNNIDIHKACRFFDLILEYEDNGSSLYFIFQYNIARIRRESVSELAGAFSRVLKLFIKETGSLA